MSIIGTDDRQVVPLPPAGSFQGVVAIDTPNITGITLTAYSLIPGSGIAIDSNHVLTANHVMGGNPNARVTPGAGVPALLTRHHPINVIPQRSLNVSNIVANIDSPDMALLTTTTSMTADANVLGMAVFYDQTDLIGMQIVTAGYPNIPTTTNTDTTGRTMLVSSSLSELTF